MFYVIKIQMQLKDFEKKTGDLEHQLEMSEKACEEQKRCISDIEQSYEIRLKNETNLAQEEKQALQVQIKHFQERYTPQTCIFSHYFYPLTQ